jgi:hypothetical protein
MCARIISINTKGNVYIRPTDFLRRVNRLLRRPIKRSDLSVARATERRSKLCIWLVPTIGYRDSFGFVSFPYDLLVYLLLAALNTARIRLSRLGRRWLEPVLRCEGRGRLMHAVAQGSTSTTLLRAGQPATVLQGRLGAMPRWWPAMLGQRSAGGLQVTASAACVVGC